MDKNTFGNSEAADILVRILNERKDASLQSKVSSFLRDFHIGFNELKKIENRTVRIWFYNLWKEKFEKDADRFDEEISKFVKNIIVGRCRLYYKLISRPQNYGKNR